MNSKNTSFTFLVHIDINSLGGVCPTQIPLTNRKFNFLQGHDVDRNMGLNNTTQAPHQQCSSNKISSSDCGIPSMHPPKLSNQIRVCLQSRMGAMMDRLQKLPKINSAGLL